MEVSSQPHGPAPLFVAKDPPVHPLNRRLGGP